MSETKRMLMPLAAAAILLCAGVVLAETPVAISFNGTGNAAELGSYSNPCCEGAQAVESTDPGGVALQPNDPNDAYRPHTLFRRWLLPWSSPLTPGLPSPCHPELVAVGQSNGPYSPMEFIGNCDQ